jgi:hypothetical protein
LSDDAEKFSVKPDGYCAGSIIENLMAKLQVPLLHDGLNVLPSLDPNSFCMRDPQSFENMGFNTVGSAIHVGLYALNTAIRTIMLECATQPKNSKLALLCGSREKAVFCHPETRVLHVPQILGPTDSTGNYGAFFPFKSSYQTAFVQAVWLCLQKSAEDFTLVYICCGSHTCCDYLYFYIRYTQNGMTTFLCNICDAEHASGTGVEKVSTKEQSKLVDAVVKVDAAFKAEGLTLSDVCLLFVTNRDSLAMSLGTSLATRTMFSNVELELLNNATFEFGPCSDILTAQ